MNGWRGRRLVVGAFLALSVVMAGPGTRKKLIYIMLDGFRYDYLDNYEPENIPGFTEFLHEGVQAEYMIPVFPSLSAPNYRTLVTGLYPESHGILSNVFYDAEEKDFFDFNDSRTTSKQKWWKTEPIWTTTTKANLKTALFMWARCDVPFDGVFPDHCEPYVRDNRQDAFKRNMEKALDKLEEGYDFLQVYHEQPDLAGHIYGPESEERKKTVEDVDKGLVYMFQRIKDMGMTDEVNIIIVSDHGMTSTAPGDVERVELDDYLLSDGVEVVAETKVFSSIKVKEGYLDKVYEKLTDMPGVDVYRHDDIPDDLHVKKNEYVNDLILKPNIHTLIMASRSPVQYPKRKDDGSVLMGMHGYDPKEEKMRAIFFAFGPDFRKNHQIPPIKNVDVYPLLTHLLQVTPKPNNGTFDNIKEALTTDDPQPQSSKGVSMTTSVLLPIVFAFALRCVD